MLQEARNVSAHHQTQFFAQGDGHVELVVGLRRFRSFYKVRRSDFIAMVRRARTYPVPFGYAGNRRYWRYGNRWFWENEGLGAEQLRTRVALNDRRRQTLARTTPLRAAGRPLERKQRPAARA